MIFPFTPISPMSLSGYHVPRVLLTTNYRSLVLLLCTAGFAVPLAASGTLGPTSQHALTYPEIVSRLYDLAHLAEPPANGEKGGSWTSSCGRGSQYDAASDTYRNWGMGDDGNGFLRKEGDNGIVAEVKGPGVVCACGQPTFGKVIFSTLSTALIPPLEEIRGS